MRLGIAVLFAVAACGRVGFHAAPVGGDGGGGGESDGGDGSRDGGDGGGALDGDGGSGGSGSAFVQSKRVLFVRGGSGTVGLNNSGGDLNACDTNNNGTEGWGALATALGTLGFSVDERLEGPVAARAPVDLSDIAQYGIVVFGSNNFVYGSGDADRVEAFVRGGGAVLFISDAGFCLTTFAEAPTSDQTFATRFDLVIDQDSGVGTTTNVTSAEFADPTHPVLGGITQFQAIGTSPVSVVDHVADVTPIVVVSVTGQVRNNDASMGTLRASNGSDGALVVADVGLGRVAGFFDRDVWTTSAIGKVDNEQLAKNLFLWLHHDL